jgi:transposase
LTRLEEICRDRPDIADLVDQGMEAVVERLLEVERERDTARKNIRRSPIGDSKTTHAPPSSDPRPKPRSQRRKTGNKSGGQPGHPGHRLEPVDEPDFTVVHKVTHCGKCHRALRDKDPIGQTAHQVFDLPKTPLVVTEHVMEHKACDCGEVTIAPAPPEAEQPTQYGPRLAGLAVYLHVQHFVPLKRTADIIETLTGSRVSEGWIQNCQRRVSSRLDPFIRAVTACLRAAKVVCCDETGFRFTGKRFWLHVCCTSLLTLLLCHRRRHAEGTEALNVLPGYTGTVVHDHLPSYNKFTTCTHSFCNEHHVRELDGVFVREKADWAERLKVVLYDGLELKRRYHDHDQDIPPDKIAAITARYEKCLQEGFDATPEPPPKPKSKRGRPKRGKTLCLLDRLRNYQTETLRFLHDRHVPWSNNQAEQDIRPMKIQQKVSGGFRSEAGAIEFCRVRSYLSTTGKNGIDPFQAIADALTGKPWLPTMPHSTSESVDEVA